MTLKKSKDFVTFGKFVKTHGIKGELRLLPFFEDASLFFELDSFYVDSQKYKIESLRQHKQFILVKVAELQTIEQVEHLLKKEVQIPKDACPLLDEDEFYVEDLIGMQVFDGDTLLGSLDDILHTPGNDVYVINKNTENEILIPAIKDYVLSINLKTKTISARSPSYL